MNELPDDVDANEVRAKAFILVDGRGVERFSVIADDDGVTALNLNDAQEIPRITASVEGENATLQVFDKDCRNSVTVKSSAQGVSIALTDRQGFVRLSLSIQGEVAEFRSNDEKGLPTWSSS